MMKDVLLKLESPDASQENVHIMVRFWPEEVAKAATSAIAGAHEAVDHKVGSRESAAATSLDAVISKLQMFVQVADEVANVHCTRVKVAYHSSHHYCRFTLMSTSSGK
jgi:hypothetical protein